MRSVTIARNYAEVLFTLGEESGQAEVFGDLIDSVAAAIENTPQIRDVLMSPRVPKSEKQRLFSAGLKDTPRSFVLFVEALIKRGRAPVLREVASEYARLVDIKLNRVRAGVTVARAPGEALQRSIQDNLTRAFGKQVIASFTTDPEILGGTVVRVGDRTYDGSLKRRMSALRRQMLGG